MKNIFFIIFVCFSFNAMAQLPVDSLKGQFLGVDYRYKDLPERVWGELTVAPQQDTIWMYASKSSRSRMVTIDHNALKAAGAKIIHVDSSGITLQNWERGYHIKVYTPNRYVNFSSLQWSVTRKGIKLPVVYNSDQSDYTNGKRDHVGVFYAGSFYENYVLNEKFFALKDGFKLTQSDWDSIKNTFEAKNFWELANLKAFLD